MMSASKTVNVGNISVLIHDIAPLDAQTTINEVAELFLNSEQDDVTRQFLSLPVVKAGRPIGTISRYRMLKIFLRNYGRELYGKYPIEHFMNSTPLMLAHDTPLDVASQYLTDNMQFPIREDFIITENGKYRGTGIVMQLLKAITDLKVKSYDQALAQKVVQLEQRELELEAAMRDAQAANLAKSRFLANMSHELRTPLNAIMGYSELLIEDMAEMQQAEYVEDLQKIYGAGSHLLQLISQVLDIAKIESGKMELELSEFPVHALLKKVTDIVNPMMEKNNNRLIVAAPSYLAHISSDRGRLKQCLLNLLSNAAKFSENGIVRLNVSCYHKDNQSWVAFAVTDQGVGLSTAQIEKLFEPFHQADNSSTRTYGGTGLGLTITKQFVTMMNGYVQVDSEPNKGSTFTLHIPTEITQKAPTSTVSLGFNKQTLGNQICFAAL
jgi:signal transduction histidine kinase